MIDQGTVDAVRNATIQVCAQWLRDERERRFALGLDGAETCGWLADHLARGVRELLVRSMVDDLDNADSTPHAE